MATAVAPSHPLRPLPVPPSLPSSQTLALTLTLTLTATCRRKSLPFSSNSISKNYHSLLSRRPNSVLQALPSPLSQVEPYLLAEWDTILKGWLCSAAAVYCLSSAVPCVGRLPRVVSEGGGADGAMREGMKLAFLAGGGTAAAYLQQALLWEAGVRCAYRMRVDAFDGVLSNDLGFFEGSGAVLAGDISHRITSESADVADMLFALFNTVVPTFLQLIAMSAQMVAISPLLSLLSALAIPCISLIIAYLGKRLREISREAHYRAALLSAYLNEVVPSMLAVKANNGERKERQRFQRFAFDEMVHRLRKKKMKAFIPHLVKSIYIGGLLLLCAASLLISCKSFDATDILSFLTALGFLISPIQDVGKAYNELKQGEPAIERLFDLMTRRSTSKVTEKPDAVDLEKVRGDIKYCGVTFRYRDGNNTPAVLEGADLHIHPGETVAVVGPSGAGKSTLAKLLLRLYDPLSGYILLDNIDIRDIRLASLRKHIALVSQDAMLFSGTVAENIGYRDPVGEINIARVENAARVANADEFIQNLPEGYQSNIGPRGSLLSGGQKQRLAIARAVYQESSVLILDEATSALDSKSELLVRQALQRLMANRTVLVIAHRLETIKMADRVVALEAGSFREIATSSV